MRPFVKWAGGKSQLLSYINEMKPSSFEKYFEPFIGGGAVLLDLRPNNAHINDINPELFNVYISIRDDVDAVIFELEKIDSEHEASADCKAFYYSVREQFNLSLNSNTPEQAARLIYINKHCFNGLYRVNSRGLFNVPFNNKKRGESFDSKNLRDISDYLQSVNITCGDFEDSLSEIESGDFVFFDSPYVPVNPTSFTDYTKEGFEYEDHVRLALLFKRLSDSGVFCMLTNHNTQLVHDLYRDYNIRVVQVSRNINSDAENRKGEEVIITNYEL